ncbi:MAG: DedA family protein [Desulfopila sp.]
MIHQFVVWLAETVGQWGYPGIFLLMTLESSFFPFPSEVVIPPAAYLAATGKMHLGLVIASGIGGSLAGAVLNYLLALYLGRPFLLKYGRYMLISEKSMAKADAFFARYGHVSTFVGRLVPGIRQYISLPAGMARMPFGIFCLATAIGAGIWVVVLAVAGYLFGKNEALMYENLHIFSLALGVIALVVAVGYWYFRKRRLKTGMTE